jgi:hypothetical protein
LILKNCHVLDIVLECSVEKTVIIIVKVLNLNGIVWLSLSSLALLRFNKCSDFLVIGIIQRGGSPPVLRVNIDAMLKKIFHSV